MTRSPTVAFGLNVTSAALNAKCGRTSVHARLALATATLKLVPMDEAACGAVLEFLETAERCPVTAGRGLQAFVIDWLDSIPARAAEDVVAGMESTALFDGQKPGDMR